MWIDIEVEEQYLVLIPSFLKGRQKWREMCVCGKVIYVNL